MTALLDRLPAFVGTLGSAPRSMRSTCTTACKDFRAGHSDPDLARAIGMRDIFTDIPTPAGFAACYVTDWAGPRSRLLVLDVALGVPFCAGDTLTLTGSVGAPRPDGAVAATPRTATGARLASAASCPRPGRAASGR